MKVLVVVNKIDRPAARPDYVVDKVFDLMMELGASDEQIDFTTVFASGLQGKSGMEPDSLSDDMKPLFDAVKDCIDPPKVESVESADLQCLVSNIDYDNFKGKMGIARVTKGSVKNGQAVALVRPGAAKKTGRLTSLFVFDNLGKKEVDSASAGEIIMFSGLDNVEIGDTLVTNEGGQNAAEPLPPIAVEQPTVRMTLGVNKSPLAGREGKFLTSRMIRDRLFKELDRNVALKVEETDSADKYAVSGRGQLHLTVLIETMRREGFELEVGPPVVIYKKNEETGVEEEPFEMVEVRVPEEYSGAVIDLFNTRNGELQDMGIDDGGESMSVIKYLIPTRGMLGLRSEMLTATRGTAIIDAVFDSYREKIKGDIQARDKGSLLAFEDGTITSFGLENAQDRGKLFVKAGEETYKNMSEWNWILCMPLEFASCLIHLSS
jgi:GTP-binding protein